VLDDVPGRRLDRGDATATLAETIDRLAVAGVVDGVGAASRAMELAVEYARERRQFDRPIGSFQAVQHLCADMLRAVELARAAAYYACWAADAAPARERHRAVTMARAFAADELYRVGASAIQVHGGIGFTWEHDVHLYYKRLLTLQHEGGGATDHLEELASLVLD
jgi:alkylation response protein AidB-like acyl-CoA dehydrogenase